MSVGIATGFGLDCPGFESQCGKRFSVFHICLRPLGDHPVASTVGTQVLLPV